MAKYFLCVFAALLLLSAAQVARAADAEALFNQTDQYIEQLEYTKALQTLVEIQKHPDLTPVQRTRMYLYIGICLTALGDAENAVASFVEMLRLRPTFRMPPGVSPSIRAMFGQALKKLNLPETPPPGADQGGGEQGGGPQGGAAPQAHAAPPPLPVEVSVKSSKQVAVGQPLSLQIQLKDPDKLTDMVVVKWRRRKTSDYSEIKVRPIPGKPLTAVISAATLGSEANRIFYFVQARDKAGELVGEAGSEDDLNSAELTEAPRKSRRWLWYTLGIGGAAVLAGAIAATVVLTSGGESIDPNAALLNVSIR